MKKRVLVAGLLACMVVPPQASAQVEAIFGIMDQMMREGARQQQVQQERERRQQEIYRQHEAQLALNRRVQTALKELGFYTMAIDGQVGPGTRRAIAEYIRAFEMPNRPLNENDIAVLESRAEAGFRSLAETRDAQSRGFTTRRDWRAAEAAGFTNAREWQQARRAGIDDQASWRRFRNSGFDSVAQYEEARARGFETRRAQERAERAGFDTQEDYAAFVESGAPDRETFERRRARLEIAGEARETCLEAVSEEDWARAAPHCSQAATVLRNDDDLLAARATATRRLDAMIAATSADRGRLQRRLDEAKDELALVETDLENLDQGSTEDERGAAETERDTLREQLDELAQELADADTMLARAERGRHRAACFTESAAERWTAAVAACTVARNADPDDRESAELLAAAEAEREAERLRAEEERRAIALADARRESAAMIEAIDAFIGAGGSFDEGLAVSRAVVNLKAALEEEPSRSESPLAKDGLVEPEAVLQAQAALADLLASERSYQAFRRARSDAERAAQASALTQAEENARRLEAFIRDHLARNVLSPHAGELLTLQEALEEVLDSDDADRIVRQQSDAMAALEALGLGADARAFSLAPRVTASDLRAQQEQAAQARVTLETAREQAGLLLAEVEDFVASGARFDAAIPVARAVATLRAAQAGRDVARVEDARRELAGVLDDEVAFGSFRTRRAEAQAVAASDGAVTAAARLARKQAFIEDHVAANPLDADVGVLLAAHGAIADALDGGVPARLAVTLDEEHARLRELGLTEAFERHVAMASTDDDEVAVSQAPGGLAITALNADLLDGDARDILVLRNVSGTAPNLRLNLRGDPVFESGRARLCWAHAAPEPGYAVHRALHDLQQAGARSFSGRSRCRADDLLEQDLVLIERRRFLEEDVLAARDLVTLFEEDALRLFTQILWEDVEAESARHEAFVAELREELAADAREGVGFVGLARGGDALCIVDDGTDVHSEALQQHLISSAGPEIALHLIAPLGRSLTGEIRDDAERIFARTGRGECGAIMADAEGLDALMTALERDGIGYRMTPIWFEGEDVAQARQAVITQDERRLRELASMRQEREAEALLRREQRETAEALRQEREDALRATHGQEARGAFNDLQEVAYAIVDGDRGPHAPANLFPEFAQWRASHVANGWEFIDREAELVDFGLADWDDRRLEAVVIRVALESRNPTLGRYHDQCVVIGYLIDAEFERRRDAFEAGCSEAGPVVEAWRTGRDFDSRWVARLEDGN